MANTYKNIVITPNIGSATDDPKITFSGANNTVNTDITLRVYPTSNGTLSFEGSAGQLFSVTNDLTGVIFSVNDISGIPSLEIDANGRVSMAQFSGNVGIGTASPTYKLDVSGDMRVTGNVILGDASTDTITLNGSVISLGNNQSIDAGTLFIDAVNNEVGIGTTSPTSNLHVIGTANITSSLLVGTTNVVPTIQAAFGAANAAFANGNTNFTVLQVASNVANIAFQTANASFANGNTNFTVLQVASNVANNGWLQANTARDHANNAYLAANSAFANGNTNFTIFQVASNVANAAFANANTTHTLTIAAFDAANASFGAANSSFANGNTNFTVLQVASNVANAAFLAANSAFANGNTNFTIFQVASNVANNGWLQANTARTHANSAFLAANSAFANANSTHTLTIASFGAANASFANGNTNFTVLQVASNVANAAFLTANSAFANGNTNFTVLQVASNVANLGFQTANAAFANGNTNFTIFQVASNVANASFANGNTNFTVLQVVSNVANAAFANSNTNFTIFQVASNVANNGFLQANTARIHANNAYLAANVANNLTVANTGNIIGSRNILNFVPGEKIVITLADDEAGNRINVNISAVGALSFTSNVGNAVANTFNIAHNLNSTTIIPAVREISTGYYVYPDIKTTTPNHIVLEFVSIPTTDQYFLILLGA